MTANYDAILIGSGIGALTVAVGLARQKRWRCLILEQNFNLGGMTQDFVRERRYHFDVGLHYVGEMTPGTLTRRVMDYVTGGAVEWAPMPDIFERFVYPDFTFDAPSDPKRYLARLQEAFPKEAEPLRRYFRDVPRAATAMILAQYCETVPGIVRPVMRAAARSLSPWLRSTSAAYLDAHFRDPRLKALLASQWGDYGVPPSKSAFAMQAAVVNHYLKGAWYPIGGAARIAEGALQEIRRAGGEAIPGMLVETILLNKAGQAIGVRASNTLRNRSSEQFFAPLIISCAGARNTYLKLLPKGARPAFAGELDRIEPSLSAVTLFLGFRESPASLGYKGENYWVFGSYDHDAAFSGEPGEDSYYLSFPSLKDPTQEAHTAQMIAFVAPGRFDAWAGSTWRMRGQDYEDLKETMARAMIARLRERHAALADMISFYEVATPLTYEYFQNSPRGAFYHLPFLPERLDWPFARCRTPVGGLYLTGSDVMSCGIVGAMMGGWKCLAVILGAKEFLRLMRGLT